MGTCNFALLVFGVFAVSHVSAFHEICAGCPVKHDPSTFSMGRLSKVLATAGVNDEVNKIISVSSQVVSGIKYTVVYGSSSGKTCTATWVEESWETEAPIDTKISCAARKSSVDLEGNSKIVGALLKAHQKQKRSLSPSDLSPDTVELMRKHVGYLIDDRTNSMYTQEVISMKITKVERLPHGYQVDADAVLAFTSCTKNTPYNPNEKCELSNNRQACSVTLTMVQPQGGRKWYKLNQFHCSPL